MRTHMNAALLYADKYIDADKVRASVRSFFPCPTAVRDVAILNKKTPAFTLCAVLSFVSPPPRYADADDFMVSGSYQTFRVSMDIMEDGWTTTFTLKTFTVYFDGSSRAPKVFTDRGHLCSVVYVPIPVASVDIPSTNGCNCILRVQVEVDRGEQKPVYATLASYFVRFAPVSILDDEEENDNDDDSNEAPSNSAQADNA